MSTSVPEARRQMSREMGDFITHWAVKNRYFINGDTSKPDTRRAAEAIIQAHMEMPVWLRHVAGEKSVSSATVTFADGTVMSVSRTSQVQEKIPAVGELHTRLSGKKRLMEVIEIGRLRLQIMAEGKPIDVLVEKTGYKHTRLKHFSALARHVDAVGHVPEHWFNITIDEAIAEAQKANSRVCSTDQKAT